MSEVPLPGWLNDVVACLRGGFGSRLETIVLFGSYARDENRPDSDVDLLVVATGLLDDPVKRHREGRMMLLPVLDRVGAPVNLVVHTPEELLENLTPLLLEVCADGVSLYGSDYFEPLRARAEAALAASGLERRWVGGTRMWLFPGPPSQTWALTWDGFRAR